MHDSPSVESKDFRVAPNSVKRMSGTRLSLKIPSSDLAVSIGSQCPLHDELPHFSSLLHESLTAGLFEEDFARSVVEQVGTLVDGSLERHTI
jgi:hypothetical protein